MSDIDKQLDEALAPLHEYPGGNAVACDYYIDKDMCDCEVANTKAKLKQLIVEATEQQLMPKRNELLITQQDMAVVLGVSRITYRKWEKNIFSMPLGKYKHAHEYLDEKMALKEESSDE